MSYAIYAESNSYVHLVAGETIAETFELLLEDLVEVNVSLDRLFNIFCHKGREEDVELLNHLKHQIRVVKNIKEKE